VTPQQLKNSILQMAMQGKLVEQRPEEGTGEELYQQIQKEKQKLIKEGKIKREKPLPEITEDEVPFEIPESWKWVRTGEIGSWGSGATPSRSHPEYYGGNIPWLKTGDLNDGYIESVPESITKEGYEHSSVRLNPIGSVLIAMYGATIGKLGILKIKATTNQACCACIPFDNVEDRYIFYYLLSHRKQFIEQGAGGAQPNISKEKILETVFPLPPLAEQKRIVAKIEEIIPYIDRYAVAYDHLQSYNTRFPDDLKKSILQMAIQGKLVPQDPNDEPASVLLEKIAKEKQKLIKEGKIKKQKPLPPIKEEEIPFEIPENWKWVYIGDVFQHNTGKALNGVSGPGKMLTYITTSNLYWNRFELDRLKEMPFTDEEVVKCTVKKNDLLVCEGGDFGRTAIWPYDEPIRIQNHIHRLRAYYDVSVWYFYYLFYFYKNAGLISGKGIGIQGLSSKALHRIIVPLPPLAEQKRIVARLDELLPQIDRLK
jgi:type I restriction enzyme S subunit